PINTVSRTVLLRPEARKLRLPVAQNVRLHAQLGTHFANRSVHFGGGGGRGLLPVHRGTSIGPAAPVSIIRGAGHAPRDRAARRAEACSRTARPSPAR